LSWFLLLYMFMLGGCGLFSKDEEKPEPDGSEYFVSVEAKGTVPKLILQGYALTSRFGNYAPLI